MNEYFIQYSTLTEIANAIKNKLQNTSNFKVSAIADKIKEIKMTNEVLLEEDGFKGLVDGSIEIIDDSTIESLCSYAFANCNLLTSVNLPSLIHINSNSFYGCTNLSYINIPLVVDIQSYSFYNCSNLTEVTLPSATLIGPHVFYGCSSLMKVDVSMPTTISNNAFTQCVALNTLILRSETVSTLSAINALYETPIASGTGYIYVPASLIDSYKTASGWSTYANQFRAIEDYPDICGLLEEVSE